MFATSIFAQGRFNLNDISKFKLKNAKKFEFVGDNLIARGNVEIVYQNVQLKADKAVINTKSWDFEADGNISFVTRFVKQQTVTQEQLERLRKDLHTKVDIIGYSMSPSGKQKIDVDITRNMIDFTASRVTGNISTGALEFKNFFFKAGNSFISAPLASRDPEGVIRVKDAKFSTCDYMAEDHEHYSIRCGKAVIYPKGHEGTFQWADLVPGKEAEKGETNLRKYNPDHSDHSIWAYNCTGHIGDVPVMWMPVMYKPQDPGIKMFQAQAGYDSDWGAYVLMSKEFNIRPIDGVNIDFKPHVDIYSSRGIGYGPELQVRTEQSKTDFMYYGIWDQKPYGTTSSTKEVIKDSYRYKIDSYRYDLRLSNLTHITPRLDFRGHFEMLSDPNFLQDFFIDRAKNDPQPVTFADLEYQFDWATLSVNARPRVNDFETVVERLPEIRLDIQRQELFWNIYYQGETTFAYLKTNWRDFDNPRTAGNQVDPKDYESMRFDTLHNLYYPFTPADVGMSSMRWLNIIPRAGFRVTGYSKTSKTKIRTEDLETMFAVDTLDGNPSGNVVNYDDSGGGKVRLIGEFGLEMNTKIYNSWNNVKNAYFELDGLRHVIKPYMNYTLMPKPTLDRREILYFDDIDRIDEQHFVRVGVVNSLQTRRGAMGNEEIYQWASMENYFDFHFNHQDDYNHFGNFGTRFRFTPMPDLNIETDILLNANSDNDKSSTVRQGQRESAKGISSDWINRWQTSIRYKVIEDLEVFARYNFQNNYSGRSLYSMGSSYDYLNSTSAFGRQYRRWQTMGGGVKFYLPFDDRKTHIALEALYDFESGMVRENKIKIVRKLHCWQAALELAQRRSRDGDGDKETKNSIMFMLYLTETPGQGIELRQSPSSRSTMDFADSSK